MKNIFIKLSLSLMVAVFLFIPLVDLSLANGTTTTTPSTSSTSSGTKTYEAKIKDPLGVSSPGELIGRIVKYLMGLIGVIAVVMIIWGGIMYMTSAGNDEKLTTAKKIITGAIIGLVISLLAYVFVDQIIKALTGTA